MKRMKPFIVIMLLACFPFLSIADQSSQSANSGKKITHHKGNNHGYVKTPKSPDRQVITCSYDGYGMDLNFTYSEGMAVLTVTDETLQGLVYNIDTSILAASSSVAYQLCKSLNFSIPSGYAKFDIKEITQYLSDDHIVYLRGADIDGGGGHAWVSDACYFCVDMNDPNIILDTYIHCDWGWGGSCNGYYSGSVFEAGSYNFVPGNYFAVEREWL